MNREMLMLVEAISRGKTSSAKWFWVRLKPALAQTTKKLYPAMWISVLHWIAIAATTKRSAVGMSHVPDEAGFAVTRPGNPFV